MIHFSCLVLQRILYYCHTTLSIILSAQVVKVQEAHLQTAVCLFCLFSFTTESVFWWMSSYQIKVITETPILMWGRIRTSQRTLIVRLWKMLGILNVRSYLVLVNWHCIYSANIHHYSNSSSVAVERVDIEGNAHSGLLVRLPFASLFDTLGM